MRSQLLMLPFYDVTVTLHAAYVLTLVCFYQVLY
jgi:hypothetical protein